MPFATIAKIREVSSEDKVHLAENLIKNQPGKKWKTKSAGEKTAYVILELCAPQQICGIDIGNEHSTFIEVLVGKENSPPGDFKEILLTSSFMTPMESRNSTNINRVRCFNSTALVSSVAANKWSLIKVVCTQPFNKHVQYGLSFIKIHVAQETTLKAIDKKKETAVAQANQNFSIIGKYKLRDESPDSDNENISRLFDRWRTLKDTKDKDLSKETTSKRSDNTNLLLCTASTKNLTNSAKTSSLNLNCNEALLNKEKHHKESDKIKINKEDQNKKSSELHNHTPTEIDKKKRKKSPTEHSNKKSKNDSTITNNCNVKYKPFSRLLEHVTLVISGIQNPDRTTLRSKALALGAKYNVSWDNTCTHLICAFKNTPKYNEVKGRGRIVTRTWLEKCYEQKKYLPWRRFALDVSDSLKDESDEEILDESFRNESRRDVAMETTSIDKNYTFATSDLYNEPPSTSRNLFNSANLESDTDDEIERAQKKMQGNVQIENDDIYEATTEEEDYLCHKIKNHEKTQ